MSEGGGGGAERTRIVCCFLGCDERPFNPLLTALPRTMHLSGAGNDAADIGESPSFPIRNYAGGGMASNWIEVGASTFRVDSLAASFSNYSRTRVDVLACGGHDHVRA